MHLDTVKYPELISRKVLPVNVVMLLAVLTWKLEERVLENMSCMK
jgi:hypothetical protein